VWLKRSGGEELTGRELKRASTTRGGAFIEEEAKEVPHLSKSKITERLIFVRGNEGSPRFGRKSFSSIRSLLLRGGWDTYERNRSYLEA